jgi:thymidylate synthase ThyX
MVQIPENFLQQKHFAETLGVPFEIPLENILQDPQIIRTARVSTGNDKKAMTDKAYQTLSLLYEGRHVTPFESVMFQFDITCPIQFADYFFAQFGSFNELSGRYSEFNVDRQGFYVPPEIVSDSKILGIVRKAHEKSLNLYDYLTCETIAREQARFVLPYSFMTKFRYN